MNARAIATKCSPAVERADAYLNVVLDTALRRAGALRARATRRWPPS